MKPPAQLHADVTGFDELYDVVFIAFILQSEFVVECELCLGVIVEFELYLLADLCCGAQLYAFVKVEVCGSLLAYC